jgi:hypothetical protein
VIAAPGSKAQELGRAGVRGFAEMMVATRDARRRQARPGPMTAVGANDTISCAAIGKAPTPEIRSCAGGEGGPATDTSRRRLPEGQASPGTDLNFSICLPPGQLACFLTREGTF